MWTDVDFQAYCGWALTVLGLAGSHSLFSRSKKYRNSTFSSFLLPNTLPLNNSHPQRNKITWEVSGKQDSPTQKLVPWLRRKLKLSSSSKWHLRIPMPIGCVPDPSPQGRPPNAGRSTGITCYRDNTHAHEAPCPQEFLGRAHSNEVLRCCPRALGGQQKCAEPWVKQGHEEILSSCWLAVGLQALTRWCPRACSLELPHLQNCLDTTEAGPRDTVMSWWPWGAFAFLPKLLQNLLSVHTWVTIVIFSGQAVEKTGEGMLYRPSGFCGAWVGTPSSCLDIGVCPLLLLSAGSGWMPARDKAGWPPGHCCFHLLVAWGMWRTEATREGSVVTDLAFFTEI